MQFNGCGQYHPTASWENMLRTADISDPDTQHLAYFQKNQKPREPGPGERVSPVGKEFTKPCQLDRAKSFSMNKWFFSPDHDPTRRSDLLDWNKPGYECAGIPPAPPRCLYLRKTVSYRCAHAPKEAYRA